MQSTAVHRYLAAGLALASMALASCSTTMSRNECQSTDWRTVGYEDGTAGLPGSHIGVHRKACGEHGVAPDFDAYQAGRAEGLEEFCTAGNGYRIGATGGQYGGVCPAEREEDFLSAYSMGRELYVLRRQVSTTRGQLDAKRRELARLEKGVVQNAAAAVDETTTKEERIDAVLDAARLAERVGQIKSEIHQLEQNLVRHEQDLDAYLQHRPPMVSSR